MNRNRWILVFSSVAVVASLFFLTKNEFFGERKAKTVVDNHAHADDHDHTHEDGLTTDSLLIYARQNLTPTQLSRLNQLENDLANAAGNTEKMHAAHKLAAFWRDSARIFAPYAHYTAEAARLENSENSLTFAAHLLLDNLAFEENQRLKQWQSAQAQDLFERSLKVNPGNDSARVGLGATLLFGGAAPPMEGIQMIRSVAEKDSTNTYAQMTLAKASVMSGQLDKALERLEKVLRQRPKDVEAILLMAEVNERLGKKDAAISWYQKSLELVPAEGFRRDVQQRITELKK